MKGISLCEKYLTTRQTTPHVLCRQEVGHWSWRPLSTCFPSHLHIFLLCIFSPAAFSVDHTGLALYLFTNGRKPIETRQGLLVPLVRCYQKGYQPTMVRKSGNAWAQRLELEQEQQQSDRSFTSGSDAEPSMLSYSDLAVFPAEGPGTLPISSLPST